MAPLTKLRKLYGPCCRPAGVGPQVCVPDTPEVEAGGLSLRLPGLYGMFKASLGSLGRHRLRTAKCEQVTLGLYITGVLQVFLTPQAAGALVVKLSAVISKANRK